VRKHTVRPHMALARISSRAIGLSAAAMILATACASGGGQPSGGSALGSGSPSTSSSGPASTALSPKQILLAAAVQAGKVTSATEKLAIQDSGSENVTITGTAKFRRASTLEVAENLAITTAGTSTEIRSILTGTTLYLNEASLARQLGKPWLKVDLSALNATPLASLAQLAQNMQSNSFVNLTRIFAATTDVRVVGTRTLDGVRTTEYAGSFRVDALSGSLAPSLRKILAPALKAMGNSTVYFHTWIDDQHHTRKMTEIETINGLTINTTVNISGINKPVHVRLPPASETVTPPGG
jgi:hypothetical protein